MTGWSGPNICPLAILNNKAYPICPDAPVTVTLTGGLLPDPKDLLWKELDLLSEF